MKYRMKTCRLEGDSRGGVWSVFDLKTGAEVFRAKFLGGEERMQFGLVACMATLYEQLSLHCCLSGEELRKTFIALAAMVESPAPVSSAVFKDSQSGIKSEIKFKEAICHGKV